MLRLFLYFLQRRVIAVLKFFEKCYPFFGDVYLTGANNDGSFQSEKFNLLSLVDGGGSATLLLLFVKEVYSKFFFLEE